MTKKLAEKKLYKPVADFLRTQCACDPDHLWWAGCGRDIALPAGFGKRKPDLVGISRQDRIEELHLVEVKLLNLPTTAFAETLAQLDTFRRYAEYLWAVFPRESWERQKGNKSMWEAELRKRGYGLLLVAGAVKQQLQPTRNEDIDKSRRKSLRDALLGEEEAVIHLPSLAPEAARAAGTAASRLVEIMAGPVKEVVQEVFGKKFKERSLIGADVYDPETACFTIGFLDQDNIVVQGDPFGWHLQDGRPVVWVWRYPNSVASTQLACVQMKKDVVTDAYVYAATEGQNEWVCRPVTDCDAASLRAKGYTEDICVGRALALTDRTMDGIRQQLRALLAWARKLPK